MSTIFYLKNKNLISHFKQVITFDWLYIVDITNLFKKNLGVCALVEGTNYINN
jgi:hypothetical protein